MLPLYGFHQRHGAIEGGRVLDYMKTAAKEGIGAEKVYQHFRGTALGYRKKVLLEDYRRVRAVELSKTWGAREKAEWWYENTFGKKQKETGWSSDKTIKWLKKGNIGVLPDEDQKKYDVLEDERIDAIGS